MRVLENGHVYDLAQLDTNASHLLVFVKRAGPRYPGNVGTRPGTTSQEVVRALIDRAHYVNAQIPAWETGLSVWLMRAIIWLYEHRAARVHGRSLSLRKLRAIESEPTCRRCGHVGCSEHG